MREALRDSWIFGVLWGPLGPYCSFPKDHHKRLQFLVKEAKRTKQTKEAKEAKKA